MKLNTLKLTPAQAEIVLDRLELIDAISDVLTDAAPGEKSEWSREEVDEEQESMLSEIDPGWRLRETRTACQIAVTGPGYSDRRNRLRREILADTMDGSTFYARAEGYGDASPLELSNIERSLEALARKMARAGISVDVVTG